MGLEAGRRGSRAERCANLLPISSSREPAFNVIRLRAVEPRHILAPQIVQGAWHETPHHDAVGRHYPIRVGAPVAGAIRALADSIGQTGSLLPQWMLLI